MRATFTILMAASVVALVGCSESGPTVPITSASGSMLSKAVVTEPATGPWARIVEGETGPGSLYAIYVPRQPNGDAVFYAHGIRDVTTPVDLRDQDQFFALRDRLGTLGYTVAWSSFSENGFAVKDGAQRVHQLRGLVASELQGQPGRSFLVGHSLGGGIGLYLAEKFSEQYDGALLMCGMVGGSLLQTQYVGNVRALFDAIYPGRLPGSVLGVPEGTVITIPQVVAALQPSSSNPLGPIGMYAIASTEQTPLPYVPQGSLLDPDSPAFQTMVGSLFGALSFHARGINNVLDITNGHSPFENKDTQYRLGASVISSPANIAGAIAMTVAGFNGSVTRVSMDPSAANYLEHHFAPSGDLRIPVLTIHNTGDPGVPEFHEGALAAAAERAGASANLLRRQVPSFGHCNIPLAVAEQGFSDLATWVSTGVRPAN